VSGKPPTHDARVCFLGDSFVQGIGDPEGLGWAGRLVRAAAARGVALTAFNLGIRGEASVEIAVRWEAECSRRLLAGTRNHLLLSFGTNDATVEDGRMRVAPEASAAALATLLTRARTLGYAVAMIGPPPTGDRTRDPAVRDLSHLFADVCAARAVRYLDPAPTLAAAPDWFEEIAAGDGAHPGASGYGLLAELIDAWPGWWFGARGTG